MTTKAEEVNANGDPVSGWNEGLNLAMDGANFVRNAVNVAGSTAILAAGKTFEAIAILSPMPFCSLAVAPFYFVQCVPATFDSVRSAKESIQHLAAVKALVKPSIEEESSDEASGLLDHHGLGETRANNIKAMSIEDKVTLVANSRFKMYTDMRNVANRFLMLGIGGSLLASGITSFLGSETAQVLGYSAILVGRTAAVALQVILAGTGAVYLVRGALTIYRSVNNKQKLEALRNEIQTAFALNLKGDVEANRDQLLTILEKHCALKTDAEGTVRDIYTGTDLLSINSEEKFIGKLKELDKAIHGAILGEDLYLQIGIAMFLGGALTLGTAFISSGTSVLIIGIVSSVMFMLLEGTFAYTDSGSLMKGLVDKKYDKGPSWLLSKSSVMEDVQVINPVPASNLVLEEIERLNLVEQAKIPTSSPAVYDVLEGSTSTRKVHFNTIGTSFTFPRHHDDLTIRAYKKAYRDTRKIDLSEEEADRHLCETAKGIKWANKFNKQRREASKAEAKERLNRIIKVPAVQSVPPVEDISDSTPLLATAEES